MKLCNNTIALLIRCLRFLSSQNGLLFLAEQTLLRPFLHGLYLARLLSLRAPARTIGMDMDTGGMR